MSVLRECIDALTPGAKLSGGVKSSRRGRHVVRDRQAATNVNVDGMVWSSYGNARTSTCACTIVDGMAGLFV